MRTISSESARDKRLAVAAFLRDSDGQNKERLAHVHGILNGHPYPVKEITPEKKQFPATEQEEKAFRRSFRIRCVVAIILTILVYIGSMTESPKITQYIKTITTTISTDYSENLFDFIKQIPYTLEYEKINA